MQYEIELNFIKIKKKLSKYLDEARFEHTMGLFKSSGVPMSTLAAFMNGRTELLKLDTLLHICEGFGITITEFFENDIFKEVEQD